MDAVTNFLTIYDVLRNQWFCRRASVLSNTPQGARFIVSGDVTVEIADPGYEATPYGLEDATVHNLVTLFSTCAWCGTRSFFSINERHSHVASRPWPSCSRSNWTSVTSKRAGEELPVQAQLLAVGHATRRPSTLSGPRPSHPSSLVVQSHGSSLSYAARELTQTDERRRLSLAGLGVDRYGLVYNRPRYCSNVGIRLHTYPRVSRYVQSSRSKILNDSWRTLLRRSSALEKSSVFTLFKGSWGWETCQVFPMVGAAVLRESPSTASGAVYASVVDLKHGESCSNAPLWQGSGRIPIAQEPPRASRDLA